jgi:hypothetical protein
LPSNTGEDGAAPKTPNKRKAAGGDQTPSKKARTPRSSKKAGDENEDEEAGNGFVTQETGVDNDEFD